MEIPDASTYQVHYLERNEEGKLTHVNFTLLYQDKLCSGYVSAPSRSIHLVAYDGTLVYSDLLTGSELVNVETIFDRSQATIECRVVSSIVVGES